MVISGRERLDRRVVIRWSPNQNHLPSTICFLYTILSCSFFLNCCARDTITVNSVLRDGETLVSAGERFELGFFPTAETSVVGRYVGIWYYNSNPQVYVWVANRDEPLPDATGVVAIADDGNLKLLDGKGRSYWNAQVNSYSSPNLAEAKLMDSGNLVLSEGRSRASLWQSFEHPTDTFLPGMKMDESLRLISWISQDNPGSGNFSFETDEAEAVNQYLIRKGIIPYWKSGESGKFFSSDEMPSVITYLLSNFSPTARPSTASKSPFNNLTDMSTMDYSNTRLIMNYTGQIQYWSNHEVKGWSLMWAEPRDRCSMVNFCGNFGICDSNNTLECKCLPGFMPSIPEKWKHGEFSDGCTRKSEICSENGKFFRLKIMKVGKPDIQSPAMNEKECLKACNDRCQCQAYSYGEAINSTRRGDRITAATCWLWTRDLYSLQEEHANGGRDLYVRATAPDLENGNTKQDGGGYTTQEGKKQRNLIIGVTMTVAGVIILSCTIVYFCLRRKKAGGRGGEALRQNMTVRFNDSARHVRDFVETDQFGEEEKKGIDLPFFDFESILAATDNFSDANKLGKGGFGPVYRGKFPGGQEIAVKRLSSVSAQGLEEFKNEVVLIARLQHRNLVRLLGYCIEGSEKILLYEYMPNKSLDAFIYHPIHSKLLDWEMRFNIILGIARGLLYLHQDSRLRIIHRDLKTSNILLDQDMNPKISDFGLARIFEGKQTEGSTNRVVGTYGYMSPEYALDGFFSVKSDVFSFGVVVLEIVSGKKNTDFYNSEAELRLMGYAWRLWQEDKALDIMDKNLNASAATNEILKCITIGLLCVQEDPNDRPNMSNVVIMLGSESATLPTPKRPAYVIRRGPSTSVSSSSTKPETNAELTVSFVGR